MTKEEAATEDGVTTKQDVGGPPAERVACVDGWTATLADDLDEGRVENDGCWTAVIVRAHGGGEYTTCGHL